ncbi:MAG: sigma-54-dependent Fis family transcriptional regulator [Myxococcales bacterium]|nr:sigma-54-dependent Fis family transcriptional regulator [Myxococcales bacterium]
MYISCVLSAEDRAFFAGVAAAAQANPFGRERAGLDARLVGVDRRAARDEVIDRLVATLQKRLARLSAADVRRYPADERELLELAVLFELFHRFAGAFDEHIRAQLAAGPRPVRLSFAHDFLRELVQRGFAADEAGRLLALSFQVRRAFYFVERALVGQSPSMRRLREALWNNIFTHDLRLYARFMWRKMEDFSTFLLGETGAGKGTAAAALGRSCFIPFDERRDAFAESFGSVFSTVNLAEFTEALLESELFGHKRGAFTGAVADHDGALSRVSHYGAVFLDEVGEVGEPIQVKLLRVLQERTFSPVGSRETRHFRGRVIAATNRSLDELRGSGRFRDDFYYRLCADVIEVPPLRVRLAEEPGELDMLLVTIVRRIVGEDSAAVVALVKEAILRDLPRDYHWPGNVRELEQCVRRVLLTRGYRGDVSPTGEGADATTALARHLRKLHALHGTVAEVARRAHLDRRTVKKYLATPR